MKRVLVATILGLAASVASSYGQATYAFDTYLPWHESTGPSGYILFGSGGADTSFGALQGTIANDSESLVANLLWQVGTQSGIANTAGPVDVDQYGLITDAYSANHGPGYTLVSFDSSYAAYTPVNFTINVTGPDAFGTISFTDPGIPVGAGYQTFAESAFPTGYIILHEIVVPEPGTLALAGLGAAALLIFRKRQ